MATTTGTIDAAENARPPNRLARQTSPYLLQHAYNPVDWWPWGNEAFAEARRRDVPIFLSIGYSTCYWCHVMERESFESDAVARVMNERFVSVKVDREERPDVDELYMAATQITTGHGGWPMSVFLEPHTLRPFWCGTYFPPEPRLGRPGFVQVLEGLSRAWKEQRVDVQAQAKAIADAVTEHVAARREPAGLTLAPVASGVRRLLSMLDREHGGFGGAPKFPQPVFLELLLDVRARAGDETTREAVDAAVRLTLDRMATGGIHDQVGGGFHRYSVDERWLVPHFEKMLYDNAQLAAVYARAAAAYDDAFYARVASRTIAYIAREMTAAGGAFFSAQDAEVDGREGLNYVWTPEQVRAAVPDAQDAALALKVYGLDDGPNFRDPHHQGEPPTNVVRLPDRPDALAHALNMDEAALLARLDGINAAMHAARLGRKQPRLDDKVLASWNGMMIAALAQSARTLASPSQRGTRELWLAQASNAARAVLGQLAAPDGGLLRTARDGRASVPAFLEDFAWMVEALVQLHAAGIETLEGVGGGAGGGQRTLRTLEEAARLANLAEQLFADEDSGGYFETRGSQADLFVRPRTSYDGAMPSGASVMVHALLGLHEAPGAPPPEPRGVRPADATWLDRAVRALAALSADVVRSPLSTANSTRAVLRAIGLGPEAAARLASIGPVPDEPAAATAFTPVEIYASAERVTVGVDTPALLRLVVRIKEGYHITAAQPGDAARPSGGPALVPLRVHVVGGTGIAAYADYPAGEPYGEGGELRVHQREVEFEVAIERQGEWTGRPLLAVTFQPCTDQACLEAMTVELDVAIDRTD